MASATATQPPNTTTTTAMTASQQNNMFEDDDEDTWSLLVSLASDSPDISSRLQSLGQRLEEDFKNDAPSSNFWEGLCKKVQSLGFSYTTQPLKKMNTPAGGSSNEYPAAFKTEGGKKHIKAVSTLLGISELRSVKITMSALRSVNGKGSNFQSLLGSRDLLMKTMLHHCHQRSARISVVTECLRLEQDPNALQRESIQQFLDSLDSAFQDGDGHDRGLYRRLLTIACASEIIPTRDQLEPCKQLHESSPASLLDAIHKPQGEQGWISFVSTCLNELRIQTGRERAEAMEALLVLLYDRIKGGVRRPDYALLLAAFKSSSNFFTENTENSRLSILAGLICAESMALWRVFAKDVDPIIGWVAGHPFLQGMQSSPQEVQMEIKSLKLVLENAAEALPQRHADSMTNENNAPAPESLALLAFGLLLHLASTTSNSPSISGMEIVIAANDKYGVFDYLSSVIHTLTNDVSKVSSMIAHDQPYDWQFSALSKPLLLESQPGTEAGADTLSYTSIACEILAATIATFGSQILSSLENITMLSNLAYKLFQNNTLLCEQVWNDWETCSKSDTFSTAEFPFWGLMDASYRLAVEGHEAFKRDCRASEEFVSNAAPFLRLAASLSHDPEVVEKTMSAFPRGLIRDALLCCRSETPSQDLYQKSKVVLLESLSSLARTGNSETCLEFLRMQLEPNTREHAMLDGPRVLGRILSARVTSEEANPVLQMTAHLLQGASQRWVLQLAQEIMVTEDTNYGLAALMAPGSDSTHSAALVLAELIEHFTTVLFCDSFIDESAVTFLQLLENGIASATSTLASSLSVGTSTFANRGALSFETVQTILQGFADFLIGIRAVCNLHRSDRVRVTAIGIRDNLIKSLASSTSWGIAIAYYAVAPVSLTLLIRLQDAVGDQKILEASQIAGDKENDANMGPWQSILNSSNQGSGAKVARASLLQFVEKMTIEDFDLKGIQARGWTDKSDDEVAPINASWSAIRLLSSWASHVEDIVQSHLDDSDIFESMPTDTKSKRLIDALSPQRLLNSLASSPIPCRESNILSATWKDVGLSHFDLLVPYLSQAEDSSNLMISAPTSGALDFLQACVAHVVSSCPPETVADSILFRAIYRSNRFYKLMKTMIESSITRSKERNLTATQKNEVCNGLFSLRIVASCAEASASVADKLLHLDTAEASLVPVLVEAASEGLTILAAAVGPRNIFESDDSVMKMRVALGCLEVLSAVWKTAFRSLHVREDSVRSRLCKAVEEQGSFILKIVQVVSVYGTGNLEANAIPSWTSEHARCTMVLFVSAALEILTTELKYSVCAPGAQVNDALKNLLLADFLRCERFASYDGYQYAAEVSSSIQSTGIHGRIDGYQLGNVLKCYPSTSSHFLLKDFYSNENSFDVSASIQLLTTVGTASSIGDIKDVVPKMAISYQTTLSELHMMNSWKKFAESISIFFSGHPDVKTPKSSQSKERLFDFAQVTISTLRRNVTAVAKSHGESTKGFMRNECIQMATLLSRLFLFFLEVSLGKNGGCFSPQTASLLSVLEDVIVTSETVFSLVAVDATSGAAAPEVLETCCKLQSPLLASAIVLLAISESEVGSSLDEFRTRRDSLYNSTCRANGRVLGVLVDLLKGSKKDSADVLSLSPENLDLLRCCIVLSTAIVARAQGPRLIESNYYHVVAESLQEYEVLSRLLLLGISSSNLAVTAQEKNKDSKPSKSFLAHLDIVLSILSLLYSVAETNDRQMLGILPKYLLAQFLSRNPLFSYAAAIWERSDEFDATRKRGYIVLDGSSFIGINDPVHEVLLATLTFLQAALRASSFLLNAQSTELSSMFVGISVEFLRTYRKPLLACLKLTKLRKNVLLEANHTLSLVAELCKRDVRDSFLLGNRDLCEDFANWTKFAVINITKFLSASGTSRELFLAIADYESSESEEITDERLSSLRLKHRHPLLVEGLPRATSEAVKNSHAAQRLCEKVTESDFKDATTVPDYLKSLVDREDESDLERNCRLSVICNFAIDMEQASAGCLSQAISLIWRLHPSSFAFRTFSVVEIQNMDAMSIVRQGVIIGFRPRAGEGALSKYQPGSHLFKSLRFGRVQSSDTISRTWEVVPLHRREDETPAQDMVEIVNVLQLAGIEDPSMRHPVTLYRPAPMDVRDLGGNNGVLTVGALILILRWCHQESLSKPESQAPEHGAIRRVAEQTVALLGAELALHEEIGSSIHLSKVDQYRLDVQIFELFADEDILSTPDNAENSLPVRYNTTGRLKHIVDNSVLFAVRPQIEPSVKRAWKEIQEKERKRREKRAFSDDRSWFSNSVHKKGSFGRKSAFRGLG